MVLQYTLSTNERGRMAGSDTTAIVLRAVFYHVIKHPSIYRELMGELDAAAKDRRLSNPIQYIEATKLPSLSSCIKETLRIHPRIQRTMGRVVGDEGVELCGVYIPAEYRVGMNSAVVHFDTSVFGPDAARCHPSRSLGHGGSFWFYKQKDVLVCLARQSEAIFNVS